MVVFVLDQAGGETPEHFGEFVPFFVHGLDFDFFAPPDRAVKPGDGETALEGRTLGGAAQRLFFAHVEEDGVEVNLDPFLEVGDKAPQIVADLGEGKADSLGVVGTLHGVDQLDYLGLNVGGKLLYGSGFFAQDCVGDGQNGLHRWVASMIYWS